MEIRSISLGRRNFKGSAARILTLVTVLTVSRVQPSCAATPDSNAQQVSRAPLFADPLVWVGAQAPSEAESIELLDDIEIFKDKGIVDGFSALEQFIASHPQSPWTPALQVHLAERYRNEGRYTSALAYWKSAWDATKDSKDAVGQKIAARTIAGLTRLLASLGRKDEMEALFNELDSHHLPLGTYKTVVDETKEAWASMNRKPGDAYRCGSFALGNLGKALGLNNQASDKFFEIESPDGGFTISQLLALAKTNGLSVVAARPPTGGELVVPALVHWKLNHYAAITAKKGDLYRVEDPTFRGHIWMTAGAIEAESSGDYILAAAQLPASWSKLSDAECAKIYGKGTPNLINNPDDSGPDPCSPGGVDGNSDSTCDPPASNDGGNGGLPPWCPPCIAQASPTNNDSYDTPNTPSDNDGLVVGMAYWNVTEPYITLWLTDIPVLYHQSDQSWMQFKISYKSRGESQNTNIAGFGDKWSCNWLGMLQSQSTNSDSIVDYLAGGGVRSFLKDGTPDYKSARSFKILTVGTNHPPALVSAIGSQNIYGYTVGYLDGTTNYFLTQRRDQYGRILGQFNYQTTNGIVRLVSAVDMDGQTNTLTYGNSNFPNLITAVTDRYGRSAYFSYNSSGLLTNSTDAQGLSSYFQYDSNENITNLVTPYGSTAFQYFESGNGTNTPTERAIRITEATGDQQLYAYRDEPTNGLFAERASYHWNRAAYAAIAPADKANVLTMSAAAYDLAPGKHWLHGANTESGALTVSDTLGETVDAADPVLGGRPYPLVYTYQGQVGDQIGDNTAGGLQRVVFIQNSIFIYPSTVEYVNKAAFTRSSLGRPTSYTLYNADGSTAIYTNIFDANGAVLQYELGPRGELVRGYGYDPVFTNLLTSVTNAAGDVIRYTHDTNTFRVTSLTFPSGLVRTNIYYTSGPSAGFLAQQIDLGYRTNAFSYTNGNICTQTNELGLVVQYAYDNLNRRVSATFTDGTTISNTYSKLDIVATKDRLNQWAYYSYDAVQQLLAATNVDGEVTTYSYCGCGRPDQITLWNGSRALTTQLSYNMGGQLTNIVYPDGYQISYFYDWYGLPEYTLDGGGNRFTPTWYQHGVQNLLQEVDIGSVMLAHRQYDEYGRVTNSVDRNGIPRAFWYDYLDRITNRTTMDPGNVIPPAVETFGYSASGLTNYIDALSHRTEFVRDTAGRILYETNGNNEVFQFTYNPWNEVLTLTDGKNQTTSWTYDSYGRVTNKVDAANNLLLTYQYDPLDRLTNRWSVAKGNTAFGYDAIGNLTSVVYLSGNTSNIFYNYDSLNRLTNMADGLGSTTFTWTDGGQLAGEDGPWGDDAVSYSYDNVRQRSGLNLMQPNAPPWTQSYSYDSVMRLNGALSPAGDFTYSYPSSGADLAQAEYMPNYNYIANQFDGMARLTNATLYPLVTPPIQLQYGYDAISQRTQEIFAIDSSGNYSFKNYSYDNIGQLKTANGFDHVYDNNLGQYVDTPRLHEQFGYAYDHAWNLSQRTNNALVQNFAVNNLNELTGATRSGTLTVAGTATEQKGGIWGSASGVTNVTVSGTGLTSGLADIYHDGDWARAGATPTDGTNSYSATGQDTYGRTSQNSITVNLPATGTFAYDLNGNLRTNNTRFFDYDDENQLIRVTEPNAWKTEFTYDGLLRMRMCREFTWSSGSWVQTNETRYVYDGQLVIQERDGNNLPLVTYTRGRDLSGALQNAGGIGGLLARTDNSQMVAGIPTATAYYFSDANGNVIALVYTNGVVGARYSYDPYGNTLTASGPLATANKYRFSSKKFDNRSGLYYYGFRFYDPNLQKWLNRDRIEELGGYNQFVVVANNPANSIDAYGFCDGDNSLPPTQSLIDFWNKPQIPDTSGLRPSQLWPPSSGSSLFPTKPQGLSAFLGKAGAGLMQTPIGDTLKDWGKNALQNGLGIDVGDKSESLGLGGGKKSGTGLGYSPPLGLNYHFTPNAFVFVNGSVGFKKGGPEGSCKAGIGLRF